MVFVNMLAPFSVVPAWLKHGRAPGSVMVPDFVIPSFLYIVGVSLDLALHRSLAARGRPRTVMRFIRRGLVLVGFGLLGSILLSHNPVREWGVLETLGAAGLVALPAVFLRPWLRVAAAGVLAGLYAFVCALGYQDWIAANDTGGLGGIAGGLAWGALVIIGSVAGNYLCRHDARGFRVANAVIAVVGIGVGLLLSRWVPLYKPFVSASYLLLSTGVAAGLLLLFTFAEPKVLPFRLLGTNALVSFIVQGIIIVTVLPRVPSASPVWVVALVAAGAYAVCLAVAAVLNRLRWFVRL
jgi:predicted acyltransferase